MFTLDCDRAYLFAHPERELNVAEQIRYDEALTERASCVPAQYCITGHQEFGAWILSSAAVSLRALKPST